MKIAFETVPNRAMLKVHTSVNFPKISSFSFEKSTEKGEELRALLLKIDGVQGVSSHDYMVVIERGGAFSFDELKPKVKEALVEFFCETIESEVEPYV